MHENDFEHRRFRDAPPETRSCSSRMHYVRAHGVRLPPAVDDQGSPSPSAASARLQERRFPSRGRRSGLPLSSHGRAIMFVVDTNIFVYAADEDSPFHLRCRERIEEWRRQATPWYASWGILYEFLRVITHPRVFRHPWTVSQAWSYVEALLASPAFGLLVPSQRHAEVAAIVMKKSAFLPATSSMTPKRQSSCRSTGSGESTPRTPISIVFPSSSPLTRPSESALSILPKFSG